MKKIYLIFLFSLLLINILPVNAQWHKLYRIDSEAFNKVAVNDLNEIYSITNNSLYRSTNEGVSWINIGNRLPNVYQMNDILVLHDTIFIAFENGVIKSTNNGLTWITIIFSMFCQTTFLFKVNDILLAGTQEDGIYKSTNNGLNWFNSSSGLGYSQSINSIAGDYNQLYASGAGSFGSIFKSTNKGQSWFSVSNNLPSCYVEQIAFGNSNVYVNSSTGFFKSSDGGNNWTQILNYSFECIYATNEIIMAGEFGAIYKSTNCGDTWVNVNIINAETIHDIDANNNLFTAASNFIFKSTNKGNNWTKLNKDISNGYYTSIIAYNEEITVATDSFGVFYSQDYGVNWQFCSGLSKFVPCKSINRNYPPSANISNKLYLSSTNGHSWYSANQPILSLRSYSTNNECIYAEFSGAGVFKTSNLGSNWIAINDGLPSSLDIISLYATDSTIIAFIKDVSSDTGWIYITAKKEISWEKSFTSNLPSYIPTAIYGQNNFVYAGFDNYGIYKSTDYGRSWIQQNTGLPENNHVTSFSFYNNDVYMSTSNHGIYRSNNQINTWTSMNEGLTDTNFSAVHCGYQHLYAVGKNIWVREELISVSNILEEIPNKFILHQNFPNPFNPSTKIQYDLPANARVSLIIYDLLGREVARLVNGEEQKAGSYEAEFDGANLASGVYFYRLIGAGNIIDTKKMVFLK